MSFLQSIMGGPVIEIVTFDPEDGAILFSSTKALDAGEHKVRAKVEEHTLKCSVSLETTEAGLHYGRLLQPQEAFEPLSLLLPRPKVFKEQRAHPRIDRVLRVSSPDLPGFQATSVDLSLSGAKLKCSTSLVQGEFLDLHIEFDDQTMMKLRTDAVVRWCLGTDFGALVGVEFEGMSKGTRSRLAYFLKALTEVERGVLHGSYQVFD